MSSSTPPAAWARAGRTSCSANCCRTWSAPILVYATLLIPTNILFEAALYYLGVGLYVPTPTWGQMLSSAVQNGYYSIDPEYMLVPGLAIFITVMAFNLFGDGLRDALDPRTR